jgi:hypothetical protein
VTEYYPEQQSAWKDAYDIYLRVCKPWVKIELEKCGISVTLAWGIVQDLPKEKELGTLLKLLEL